MTEDVVVERKEGVPLSFGKTLGFVDPKEGGWRWRWDYHTQHEIYSREWGWKFRLIWVWIVVEIHKVQSIQATSRSLGNTLGDAER